jgi:hypothetical protein
MYIQIAEISNICSEPCRMYPNRIFFSFCLICILNLQHATYMPHIHSIIHRPIVLMILASKIYAKNNVTHLGGLPSTGPPCIGNFFTRVKLSPLLSEQSLCSYTLKVLSSHPPYNHRYTYDLRDTGVSSKISSRTYIESM